ncbi:MAG: GNAT family N-acetyltransferase [Prevotella sp.]|nr:GNAT family N-acetyltransferase [Bacteroides sp.]MCM1367062.1 GNAT family N-acetyltransferase [Prevotella sp.]MCM1437039.1 GNAT family N-acetyltransferase [Prevotella sp.]
MKNTSWEIKRYNHTFAEQWNDFVSKSRNATFMFLRDYMDYHADRFEDFSLLAFNKGELRAVLPANRQGDTIYSHQGLTYGGWIFPLSHIDAADILNLFSAWRHFSLSVGLNKCIYKPIPYIYTQRPAQEDIYALFRFGATISTSNISAAIYLPQPAPQAKWQRRYLNIASRTPGEISLSIDREGDTFHKLLCNCLRDRHNTSPVHSLDEFKLLLKRFPDNILPYLLSVDNIPQTGICIFLSDTTAHCQYIATTEFARDNKLLSLLVNKLIELPQIKKRRYFDFGTSNLNNGLSLNNGLYHNKFSFGAGGVAYQTFTIDFNNPPLNL